MSLILTTIVLFLATNIDDIFLLLTWFSQRNASLKSSHIIAGQYVGFILLLVISITGSLGALIIPQAWIGLLGLIPVYLGVKAIIEQYKERKEDQGEQEGAEYIPTEDVSRKVENKHTNMLQKLLHPNVYKVAAVTFANGGDNIGVYIPFLATYTSWQVVIIVIIFLAFVALLCYIAYKLISFPFVAQALEKYGHIAVPFVLIALGILILKENGTLTFFM
ncbi:cadmium resistance transporter [Priestia megaterium]|uniref:cadmium resistance transporter n=1 Tax=Priestia megaterium TaxID=1404 RepID=UPI00366AAC4D